MDDLARSPVENPSVRAVWHDRLTVSVAMFSIIFEDKGEAAGTARGREGSLSGKTARRREDYSSSEYRPFVSSSGKPSLFCEGGKSVDATNACSNDIAGIFFFSSSFFFFFSGKPPSLDRTFIRLPEASRRGGTRPRRRTIDRRDVVFSSFLLFFLNQGY